MTAVGTKSNTEVADFLLLQSVNRWQALVSHLADSGNIHPETLYRALIQMAGEFATFTDARRRPNSYPAYRHEDLQRSFTPVVADVRRSLSAVLEQTAIRIPLRERQHGVRVGPIVDRTLLNGTSFVLVVQADMAAEALRRTFPEQGEGRSGRAYPRARQRSAARYRPAATAGGPAADAVHRWRAVFRAGSQQPALAADAVVRRLRHPCRRFPQLGAGSLVHPQPREP